MSFWSSLRVLATPARTASSPSRLTRLSHLLSLFSRSDEGAETRLAEKLSALSAVGELTEEETRILGRLRELMELRALAFGHLSRGKARLRQGFVTRSARSLQLVEPESDLGFIFSMQDITESATIVANLHWKLYDTCLGHMPELKSVGLKLYHQLFGAAFQSETAKIHFTRLTDAIQRDRGVPFLILNLLRQNRFQEARQVGRHLLEQNVELQTEDRASALYWLAELFWFQQAWSVQHLDHESSLRFLYHLCFTAPDRAGFLEIDSSFFPEFEGVNELAREAFTYRETLMQSLLDLWEVYEDFDVVFQKALEAIVGKNSKIYDSRASWEKLWKRNQESFSRDYLYVVEGNLCFKAEMYQDAAECYQAALAINSECRPAWLNLAFAYAHMEDTEAHETHCERLLSQGRFLPTALYVVANSHLILGQTAKADSFYERLRRVPGWENRVDFYRSTFCYQHELFEAALHHGKLAMQNAPNDPATLVHLSLCYDANGKKDQALKTLKTLKSEGHWIDFYRFTLERDLGNHPEAAQTLLKIPSEYFEDPQEWEAALSYARGRRDLGLMRHLKKR